MILSVSRRTDIPAFYTEWFFNRLKDGYVLVRNPMNVHQVSRVTLSPAVIDCIVFWTKNPLKMLDRLADLEPYPYYFQITITPYDKTIERGLPPKNEIMAGFRKLSERIGKEKTIWRYDPIILTKELDKDFHVRAFEKMASALHDHTEKCVISFVDAYKKSERNMRELKNQHQPDASEIIELSKELADIADKYQIRLETCSEAIDLSALGIDHGKCIDSKLISRIVGEELWIPKDKNQRKACGCAESIDIGAYHSCGHGCLYCYANFSDERVSNNRLRHDPRSPMQIGGVEENSDVITDRKMVSYRKNQMSLPLESRNFF